MNLFLFGLALFSLSQSANLIRIAQAPVEVIGFWRLLGAGLVMICLCLKKQNRIWPRSISKRTTAAAILSGILFFAHLWTFSFAAQTATIANSMIIFAANPLFTALASLFFFKEKIETRMIFVYLLAFAGLYQLLHDRISISDLSNLGNWSALASAALYSGYILLGARARKELPNLSFSWLIYLIAAFLFFATGTLREVLWTPYPILTWLAILGTIALPTLLGHALFTYLLKYLNVNWMSCGKLLEPALSAFVAFLLFSENPSRETYWAFALTSLAGLLLFAPWKSKAAKAKNTAILQDPIERPN